LPLPPPTTGPSLPAPAPPRVHLAPPHLTPSLRNCTLFIGVIPCFSRLRCALWLWSWRWTEGPVFCAGRFRLPTIRDFYLALRSPSARYCTTRSPRLRHQRPPRGHRRRFAASLPPSQPSAHITTTCACSATCGLTHHLPSPLSLLHPVNCAGRVALARGCARG